MSVEPHPPGAVYAAFQNEQLFYFSSTARARCWVHSLTIRRIFYAAFQNEQLFCFSSTARARCRVASPSRSVYAAFQNNKQLFCFSSTARARWRVASPSRSVYAAFPRPRTRASSRWSSTSSTRQRSAFLSKGEKLGLDRGHFVKDLIPSCCYMKTNGSGFIESGSGSSTEYRSGTRVLMKNLIFFFNQKWQFTYPP